MCGIFAVVTQRDDFDLRGTINEAGDAIHHRGPDAGGFWMDVRDGIGLAHRRLSIVDLSSQGNQPMISASGNLVICFNGEIYNHAELRNEIESKEIYCFQGSSDTEVFLAAIELWGLERTLEQVQGMYAFILWNKSERTMSLVRDRMGEKPLYYGWNNGAFWVSSELKAMYSSHFFIKCVDIDSVKHFMRHGNIAAPWSIMKGIYKMLPGHSLKISLSQLYRSDLDKFTPYDEKNMLSPKPYWSIQCSKRSHSIVTKPDTSYVKELDTLLTATIEKQLKSDVNVGAFLSGGVDSSLVVMLAQRVKENPISTFTIGFEDSRYSESAVAKKVAQKIGT